MLSVDDLVCIIYFGIFIGINLFIIWRYLMLLWDIFMGGINEGIFIWIFIEIYFKGILLFVYYLKVKSLCLGKENLCIEIIFVLNIRVRLLFCNLLFEVK